MIPPPQERNTNSTQRRQHPAGIIFREPILQIEPPDREDLGRGKRHFQDDHGKRIKKKQKIVTSEDEFITSFIQ